MSSSSQIAVLLCRTSLTLIRNITRLIKKSAVFSKMRPKLLCRWNWLNIVASESCGKDLPKCRQKYEELDASRVSILDQAESELQELFSIDSE